MAVTPDPDAVRTIAKTATEVNGEEIRVNVGPDITQIFVQSPDETLLIKYTVSTPPGIVLPNDTPEDFWIPPKPIKKICTIATNEITVTFPFETADSMFECRSANLTYRLAQLDPMTSSIIPSPPPPNGNPTFTLRHGVFAKIIKSANLFGNGLEIVVDPDGETTVSSAKNDTNEWVTGHPPPDALGSVYGPAAQIYISIERLHEVLGYLPRTPMAAFHIEPERLVYTLPLGNSDVDLTLYISAVQKPAR